MDNIGLSYGEFERHLRHLQGRVLTIVDASHADHDQRKAIKDLVNSAFSLKMIQVHDDLNFNAKESSQDGQNKQRKEQIGIART